jgi:hypothetical protein
MKKLMALLIFACLYNSAFALVVLDPNYTVEIYSVYQGSNVGDPWRMTFDDEDNLYITSRYPDYVWRVDPNANVSLFLTNFPTPRGIDYGGGTSFGNYLYITSTGNDRVYRVTKAGSRTSFSSTGDGPGVLKIDKVGNYNNRLYVGTSGDDRIYRVTPSGSSSLFSNFFGTHSNGGVFALAFDPGTKYGGSMYVGAAYPGGTFSYEGLFKMNTSGGKTRFSDYNDGIIGIHFDPGSDFDGHMFVNAGYTIKRVTPEGITSNFAMRELTWMRAFTFGNDGNMYVGEYDTGSRTVVISRVLRTPVPVEVDIKPGSCPNPLNLNSKGKLPVAILGSQEVDVNTIDINSITLDGASAIKISYEDVNSPAVDSNDCNCMTLGPDGYTDLNLNFKIQGIVDQIFEDFGSDLERDQLITLTLRGKFLDGTNLIGSDCVLLVGNVPKFVQARIADLNQDGKVNFKDLAILAEFWLESTKPE